MSRTIYEVLGLVLAACGFLAVWFLAYRAGELSVLNRLWYRSRKDSAGLESVIKEETQVRGYKIDSLGIS